MRENEKMNEEKKGGASLLSATAGVTVYTVGFAMVRRSPAESLETKDHARHSG